jgi:DNA mismatch repair protein MutL
MCFDLDTKELFLDILDGMDITNRTNKQEVEEKFIATVACKAAVKANMNLDRSEIEGLLNELLVLENPFTCPHGRPTAIRITKTEIEKKFGR